MTVRDEARPRFLHMANGSATTDLIVRAGIPGETSIWADPLHEGPVPGAIDYRELCAVRARHIARAPDEAPYEEERRLLDLAAKGPLDPWTAFSQMHDGEDAFFIADSSFLGVARELAALTPPLLAIDGWAIQTTVDGMAVLNGRADRVALCGIDTWLGGTHLEGRGPVWRWDHISESVRLA